MTTGFEGCQCAVGVGATTEASADAAAVLCWRRTFVPVISVIVYIILVCPHTGPMLEVA